MQDTLSFISDVQGLALAYTAFDSILTNSSAPLSWRVSFFWPLA